MIGAQGLELNCRPTAYKAVALPLSYEGIQVPYGNDSGDFYDGCSCLPQQFEAGAASG